MEDLAPKPADPARYSKRLAIIIPYRDRAEHRAIFLAHMRSYFERDKLDRHIAVTLHFVEQSGTAPFNRGKLCNVGYQLTQEGADYFCFHDVDYLPVWADYSWSPRPTRVIWHGLRTQEDWNTFFSAVTLFDKPAFQRINGFSNAYWGWGFEDVDLQQRCAFREMVLEHRDGTFQPLQHQNAGFSADGVLSPEAQATRALFLQRQENFPALVETDGLSNVSFVLLKSDPVSVTDRQASQVFHHLVDIGLPET